MRPEIPTCGLQECHEAVAALRQIKTFTVGKSPGSLRLNLYDDQQRMPVSFASMREQK